MCLTLNALQVPLTRLDPQVSGAVGEVLCPSKSVTTGQGFEDAVRACLDSYTGAQVRDSMMKDVQAIETATRAS